MFHLFFSCLLLSVGVYSLIFGMEINRDPSVDLATVLNHVNQLEIELRSTMTELQATKDELGATTHQCSLMNVDIQALKTDLAQTKARQQEQEETSASINSSMNIEIQALQYDLARMNQIVAFYVYLAHHKYTGPNLALKFDTVLYNAGNGYNTTTGHVTAPVSGTYIFSTKVVIHEGPAILLQILRSGSIVGEGYAELQGSGYVTIPATAITFVKQGESVWVDSYTNVSLSAFKSTNFAGALLSPN